MDHKRELALKIAWKFYGLSYIWGGDDPIKGVDCSGLVVEILKSVGVLSRKGDWNANSLYQLFNNKPSEPKAGCLVLWGNNKRMTHIEFCIDGVHTMGASGGGSANMTREDAIRKNAYVKVRPIVGDRGKYKAIVDPFQE